MRVLSVSMGFSRGRIAAAQETALTELRAAAQPHRATWPPRARSGARLIEAGRLSEAEAQMKVVERLGKGSIEALYEARRVDFAGDNYKKARRPAARR